MHLRAVIMHALAELPVVVMTREHEEGQTRELLAVAKPTLKFAKRSPEMASLIMAAEPLVGPVAATVALQPID